MFYAKIIAVIGMLGVRLTLEGSTPLNTRHDCELKLIAMAGDLSQLPVSYKIVKWSCHVEP